MVTFAADCQKQPLTVKNNKYHIIHSWVLLICFVAGQYMVYAHQHKPVAGTRQAYSAGAKHARPTVTEKCRFCDAMHHISMIVDSYASNPVITTADYIYQSPVYHCTSFALILKGGRAPPLNSDSV